WGPGLVSPSEEGTDEHPEDHAHGRSGIRQSPLKATGDGTHPFSSLRRSPRQCRKRKPSRF
ncbi:MAG: hypothetical protein AVDCRST_MAG05-3176, partial [uncultured Rubrobacteraceae bacterium]